jgi:glycosyltransferase involved in cell wall biosynthesis
MNITWSLPVRGERLGSSRGDLVRAQHLIAALGAKGHQVKVIEDAAAAGSRLAVAGYRHLLSRVLPTRSSLVMRDLGRWLHSRRHGRRVAVAAGASDAQVIIETQVGFAASGAQAAARTGLPLVLDDCSPSSEEGVLGVGLPRLARRVMRQQAHAAAVVVAVTEDARRQLAAEGVPPERIVVVPNGVDPKMFEGIDGDAVRRRLGVGDRPLIGFVGSFQPWHRVELLVSAFERLDPRLEARLLLVGDGPGRAAAEHARRHPTDQQRVRFLGALPAAEVPPLLTAIDVAVMPASNSYGHPMKLLEYAAAGCAIVAPDLGTVRALIEDGVNGMLIPSGDLDALVRALERLLTDGGLRGRLAAEARDRVHEGDSWADRAGRLLEALSGVSLGAGSSRP